jgi:hypothetical protein
MKLALHKAHRAGDKSPAEHDARDPFPRAEPFQREVRRHLKNEIAEEENGSAETVSGGGKPQVAVHRQRGEAHVHAVEIGDEIADDQETAPTALRVSRSCVARSCPR